MNNNDTKYVDFCFCPHCGAEYWKKKELRPVDFSGNSILPGSYWYKSPHWDRPLLVCVKEDQDGDLTVKFPKDSVLGGNEAVKMQDLPAISIFRRCDEQQ